MMLYLSSLVILGIVGIAVALYIIASDDKKDAKC